MECQYEIRQNIITAFKKNGHTIKQDAFCLQKDSIKYRFLALQQEKPVQNQKTDHPVKFHSSGYLWIYKIREKLNSVFETNSQTKNLPLFEPLKALGYL